MSDPTFSLNLWTGAAILVVLYLARWRLHPLYHIPTVGGTSLPLLSYIGARRFVHNAKAVLQEGYSKYPGTAFKVPMLDRWMVFVSGPEMIDDIRRRPDDEMSFSESIEDDMQMRHVVHPDVINDPYHVDMIKEKLTQSLPGVMPDVIDELRLAVPEFIPADSEEWVGVDVLGAMQQIIARASARVFVGLPLCRNREYLDLAIRFAIDIVKDSDRLKWWPQFLKPYVSMAYSLGRRSLRRNAEILQPFIRERKEMMEEWGDDWTDKPNDLLQWFMSADKTNTEYKTIPDRVMVINFAAIHTSSTSGSLTLLRLAERPEYIQPIREEIETVLAEEGWTKAALGKMWKLDSLLKEFQRHQGFSLASLTRKVMKDITLPDGTFLPRGTAVLATSYNIHHEEAKYENPDVFDPFRFSRVREGTEKERVKNQFVNTSVDYIAFGHGRHACPGRFFAANELKGMLAYIILNYDFKMGGDGRVGPVSYDGLTALPATNGTVMFKKRASKV